jgi:hypothetical protein
MDSGSCCREDQLVRDEVVGMKLLVDRYCVKKSEEKAEKEPLTSRSTYSELGRY